MTIGVDFDDTIICYDGVFHAAALEFGLIEEDVGVTRKDVRNALRQAGKEDAWAELQGHVYGKCLHMAEPFEGVREFFSVANMQGFDLAIICHKSLHPHKGPKYDLHAEIIDWLREKGFVGDSHHAIPRERVSFVSTVEDKIDIIADLACSHYIDDRAAFFDEVAFPLQTVPVLFDPREENPDADFPRVTSWRELTQELIEAED